MLWEWFWYWVPWELKAAIVAGLVLLGYVLLGTVLRWPDWLTPKWLILGGAAIATALGANMLAQRGWRAKEARDLKDAEKFIDAAQQSRQNAETAVAKAKASGKLREDPHGRWRD